MFEYAVMHKQGNGYPDGGAVMNQPTALLAAFNVIECVMAQRERAAMEAMRMRSSGRGKHGTK